MLWTGSYVNEKVITHDYYEEKISEWRIILQEEQTKKINKENAARKKLQDETNAAYEREKKRLEDPIVTPVLNEAGYDSPFGGKLPREGSPSRREKGNMVREKGIRDFKTILG